MRPLFLGKEAEVKTRLSQFGLLAIAAGLVLASSGALAASTSHSHEAFPRDTESIGSPGESARPDIPPPPETPQQFAATRSLTAAPASMPQAWRLKALQLFKANNSLDKNSIFATRLQTSYDSAFEALRSDY